MSNSSPVIWGDLLFVSTSERPGRKPRATFLAARAGDHRAQQEHRQARVGRQLGRGSDSSRAVVHTVGRHDLGGVDQVISAQGDGWVRGYEATTGKKLWEFDTNPEGFGVAEDAQRADLHAGDLPGSSSTSPTVRIPSTARASVTFTRSIRPSAATSRRRARSGSSTRSAGRSRPPAIADGLIFIPDFSGFFHCLDAKTGQEYWVHDLIAGGLGLRRSSPTARSTSATRTATSRSCRRRRKRRSLPRSAWAARVYSTPVPAHGALFIMNSEPALLHRGKMTRAAVCAFSSSSSILNAQGLRQRRMDAVPRQPRTDRRGGRSAARRRSKLLWKYEMRHRAHRFFRGHRRRRGVCRCRNG